MQDQIHLCGRCGSNHHVKAGFVNQMQRYKCKDCGFHFTEHHRGVDADIKRLAVHLYLEGLGYRAISRITGVSDVAVAKWIRPVEHTLLPLRKNKVKVNDIHKMEHFFITKELFNQYGWLLIGMEENRDICLLGSYTTGTCRLS